MTEVAYATTPYTETAKLLDLLDEARAPLANVKDASNDASRKPFSFANSVDNSTFMIKPIYYDGLPYKGNPTNVFAYVALPEVEPADKIPAVVLVQGGGGTAFSEWVRLWSNLGYVAISIAVEGQTDEALNSPDPSDNFKWVTHSNPGPRRPKQIFGDWKEPIEDHWMFHSLADVILAHNLLRSYPFVDRDKIGLMGVSWGGTIVSTTVGIDTRFAFMISCYGCGLLKESKNYMGRGLAKNPSYEQVWDAVLGLPKAQSMPKYWISHPPENNFPLDIWQRTQQVAGGEQMRSIIPGLGHGHQLSWKRQESYAFANSITRRGAMWCRQVMDTLDDDDVYSVTLESVRGIDKAELWCSTDSIEIVTTDRTWHQEEATVDRGEADTAKLWRGHCKLPTGTTTWWLNFHAGPLVVSSEFHERGSVCESS